MVQFLKGALDVDNMEILKRLEPEFKIFRFEKTPVFFDRLTEEEKAEARICILNGLNFAKKVLVTGECDILILDEILGILDEGVISGEEMCAIIAQARNGQIQLILLQGPYIRSAWMAMWMRSQGFRQDMSDFLLTDCWQGDNIIPTIIE